MMKDYLLHLRKERLNGFRNEKFSRVDEEKACVTMNS